MNVVISQKNLQATNSFGQLEKDFLRRRANPGKVSMDSDSLAKIKNIILNTLPRTLAP
jgi:hypothetical protein